MASLDQAAIGSAESVLPSEVDQAQTLALKAPIFVRRNLSQVVELVWLVDDLNVSLDV